MLEFVTVARAGGAGLTSGDFFTALPIFRARLCVARKLLPKKRTLPLRVRSRMLRDGRSPVPTKMSIYSNPGLRRRVAGRALRLNATRTGSVVKRARSPTGPGASLGRAGKRRVGA